MNTDTPNPGLVIDTLNAFQKSAALKGAIDLELFSKIGTDVLTAAQIADRCQTDLRATRILCDFLVVNGFLTKEDLTYRLNATSSTFLDIRSPKYLGSIAKFIQSPDLQHAFSDVASLLRRGHTSLPDKGTVSNDYEGWVEFAQSMVPMMMSAALFMGDWVAKNFHGEGELLDVAAGHGMFGIQASTRNSKLKVTALDWEQVLQVAKENVARAGLESQFTWLGGDAFEVQLPENRYDLVMLTNFLHHFSFDRNVAFLKKIRRTLRLGGRVLTLEFVPDENRITPPAPATFALTMLATTPDGDAYTFSEYQRMGEQAGFTKFQCVDVPHSIQRLIICG